MFHMFFHSYMSCGCVYFKNLAQGAGPCTKFWDLGPITRDVIGRSAAIVSKHPTKLKSGGPGLTPALDFGGVFLDPKR